MVKLNKKKATQTEILGLIDRKATQEYTEFISQRAIKLKIVRFGVTLFIEEGSVTGNVLYEEVAKLKGNFTQSLTKLI